MTRKEKIMIREYNDMMMRLVEWIGTPLSTINPVTEAEWCRALVDNIKGAVEACSEDYRQGYYQYLQDNLVRACGHGWASGSKYRDRLPLILNGLRIVTDTRASELCFVDMDKVGDFLYQIPRMA